MPVNPFLAYLRDHPSADALALKELFRVLAKRAHPDTGGVDAAFVRLHDAYSEALDALVRAQERAPAAGRTTERSPGTGAPAAGNAAAAGAAPERPARTPRERVLHELYRYKAHLRSTELDARPVPPACRAAFARAVAAARDYSSECHAALSGFDEQFHARRAVNARFPEVAVKYGLLVKGLAAFFDYLNLPSPFTKRLLESYLREVGPMIDYDPARSPELRTNRSAPARSALFRMRSWLEAESLLPPCSPL